MAMDERFKGMRLPAVAAPMFLVSGVDLVVEACRAGIVGTFPALNQRTTEGFREWVVEIKTALAEAREADQGPVGPFGVNLIVHHSNPRLEADLAVCVEQEVPLVITSLGAVEELVETVHGYGGVVFHDVTTRRHAEKAAEAGVDGLILVGAGAGGHAGTLNHFGFLAEVKKFFKGTMVLAGGLSTGRDVAAAQAMGADLAYMGTRFIATKESQAQGDYKAMICDAVAEDIVHTPAVSGVPANFMAQSLEANGFDMEALQNPGEVNFGEKLSVDDEAKAWKTVWSAGHGVSAIEDVVAVRELVDELEVEYAQGLEAVRAWAK